MEVPYSPAAVSRPSRRKQMSLIVLGRRLLPDDKSEDLPMDDDRCWPLGLGDNGSEE